MLLIFIFSLLVRSILILRAGATALTADARVYAGLASDIVDWGGLSLQTLKNFPLKDHPVYPLFVAAHYHLFGTGNTPVWITQSILGAFVCVLVYLIAGRIFEERIALLAGLIAAVYPVFVKLSVMMLSEGVFLFLFVLAFLPLVKYLKAPNTRYLVFSAFLLGLAALTRSVILLFPLLLGGYLFVYDRKRLTLRKNIGNQAVLIIIFAATVSLWSIRNYYVSGGQFIPVTDAADRGLYSSFCPHEGKIFGIRPDNDPVMQQARDIGSLAQRRDFFLSKTVEFIKNNPAKTAKIELLKVLYLWSPFDWEIIGDGYARFNFGFVFLLPFFVYGTAAVFRRKQPGYFLLFLPIIYFQLIHLVYFALPRFRIGFEPFFVMISAFGALKCYDGAKNKPVFIELTSIFLAVNLVLFMYSEQVKLFFREVCRLVGIW